MPKAMSHTSIRLSVGIALLLFVFSATGCSRREDNSAGGLTSALEKYEFEVALMGERVAQFNLAIAYHQGNGVPLNVQEAAKWYGKAAENGHAGSQFNLGKMYHNGVGVPENAGQAAEWYARAADQGLASAQCGLAGMYWTGDGVPQDKNRAVAWYRKAAEQGERIAQYYLGKAYLTGEGVQQDTEKAVMFFERSADQNFGPAQARLGLMHLTIDAPIEGNAEVGHELLTKAMAHLDPSKLLQAVTDRNDPLELHVLAGVYSKGLGVESDREKAVSLYHRAAMQGFAESQLALGQMYFHGHGVQEDKERAVELLLEAARQGSMDAQHLLALAYFKGQGVTKDLRSAADWSRKAALQGHPEAQLTLGCTFAQAGDDVEAYKWGLIAQASGSQLVGSFLAGIRSRLSVEQIEEAERRAKMPFSSNRGIQPTK